MSADKEFKDSANKSYKEYTKTKKLWKWGIGGAVTIATAGILIPLAVKNSDSSNNPYYNIAVADSLIKDDVKLSPQHFFIDNSKDTIIESSDGIVFAIKANTFLNEDGKNISGQINLVIKEALSADEIVSSGLSTTSNGKLLETGGMFYLNAFNEGKEVKINPKNAIQAKVPTEEVKPGMMLYDGEKTADGQINWVNPTPLEKYLLPVDILSLDFYPGGYEKKLEELGHGENSKEWNDSVYYSFSSFIEHEYWNKDTIWDEVKLINPAKIKSIWDLKFNNTILATKEFESRLKFIFTTCDNAVLDLYISNLNKNMYEIDEMAAAITSGEIQEKFKAFAARKDGKVKINDMMAKRLTEYYHNKSKKYAEEAKQISDRFYRKQEKLNEQFTKAQNTHIKKEVEIASKNFAMEYEKNLNETYKQLGFKKMRANPITYTVPVIRTGWKNIDQIVMEATTDRMTTQITLNGKTAKIVYNKFSVNIPNKKSFDRIYSYLLADSLYSFQRMNETESGFNEKLNGFFKYNLALVAYKGDSMYFYSQRELPNAGGEISIELKPISKIEFKMAISGFHFSAKRNDILEDLKYENKVVANNKRVEENKKMEEMRWDLYPVIAPCHGWPADTAAVDSVFAK